MAPNEMEAHEMEAEVDYMEAKIAWKKRLQISKI